MMNKQAARDKQLLAWDRERTVLKKRLRNPPVQVLAEPIQQGWKRHFVLAAEARLRPDAAVLAAILGEINTVVYHWRRDFLPSRRQVRLSRRTLSSEQFLRAVGIKAWECRAYPDAWLRYFRRELVPHSLVVQASVETLRHKWVRPHRWERRSGHVLAFAFRHPRLFTLKTERHWLTHLKQLEPEVVERLDELEAHLNGRNGFPRLGRLYGRSFRAWRDPDCREKILRQLAEREMRAHLGASSQIESPGAADAMPPPTLRGGGLASAASGWKPIFAAVRPEILRYQKRSGAGISESLVPGLRSARTSARPRHFSGRLSPQILAQMFGVKRGSVFRLPAFRHPEGVE